MVACIEMPYGGWFDEFSAHLTDLGFTLFDGNDGSLIGQIWLTPERRPVEVADWTKNEVDEPFLYLEFTNEDTSYELEQIGFVYRPVTFAGETYVFDTVEDVKRFYDEWSCE